MYELMVWSCLLWVPLIETLLLHRLLELWLLAVSRRLLFGKQQAVTETETS